MPPAAAAANPFINPPRLPSPSRPRLHNRQLSRSPVRQNPRDCDVLLRDLSPTSTLRAFITLPHETSNQDALAASIKTSSASERALGAKAAQVCLDLRSWALEIEGWQWPGTFEFPESAREKLRLVVVDGKPDTSGDKEEYWGSLLARDVKAYEERADEISQRLDDIDVEELKEFVLNSHYRADSRPSSRDKRLSLSSNTSNSANMKRLDDYTALVTATILQALPFLTRLSRLLDIWTIRLIVLRNAPRYLADLQRARMTLENGWTAIRAPSNLEGSSFDRKTMSDMKNAIEQQVGSLGRRLDRFLDDLEGRDDTVPESWIDEFEVLEAAYGSWVVQAERKMLEHEWAVRRDSMEQRPMTAMENQSVNGLMHDDSMISEVEDPALDEGAVMRPSMDIRHDDEPSHLHPAGHPQLVLDTSDADRTDGNRSAVDPSHDADSSPNTNAEEAKQNAKRRAAFLHDIEINNSLKQSKSPVRPFEHASSAFTKLFKKHQSPEQVRMKRSTSNNVNASGSADAFSPRDRKPLTPSSATGSKWNSMSRQSSMQPTTEPTKEVRDMPSSAVAAADPAINSENRGQRVVSEPTRSPPYDGPSFGPFPFDVREKPAPETYKPTGLDSPFSSPDKEDFADTDKQDISEADERAFPENWPLERATEGQYDDESATDRLVNGMHQIPVESDPEPEIYKPATPLQTDAFDQMFVQNMPQISDEALESMRAPDVLPLHRPSSSAHEGPATYLDMVPARSRRSSVSRPTSACRPTSSSRPKSASRDSEHASIRSGAARSPAPEYAHGLQNDSPNVFSARFESSSPRTSPTFIRSTIDSSSPISPASIDMCNVEDVPLDEEIYVPRPYPIKRASTTSIEIFSRSEVKSVDVQRASRQGSTSSRPTPPQTPKLSSEHDPFNKARPMNYKGMVAFPAPPVRRSSSSGQAMTPVSSMLDGVKESSPQAAETSGSPANEAAAAPLNVAMAKRRVKKLVHKENERPASPALSAPYVDARDTFDRHVSEVLESLPAQIRFKPRAGAETPVARGYMAPKTKMPNMRVPSRSSNMTIAPAESSPKKSSLASDPEVKLYHLTQAGREEPIKLFVRLVGEGERVMVRVGGGWADLADYLRQYADHHGSRTVSEGAVEVQALTSTHARKVSGPAETRARTPGPGTPNPGTPLRPISNDSDKDFFGRAGTPNGDRAYATNGRQTPNSTYASTPKSTSTGSRPSTANASRPPSRQGGTADVGLGGPSSGKKGLLPEHKAKWVESMLDRAKKASAEKSKEDNQKYFSELGKVGGTRRVIFRSSPGVSTGEKNK